MADGMRGNPFCNDGEEDVGCSGSLPTHATHYGAAITERSVANVMRLSITNPRCVAP
jgi:hypothetical protein